MFLSYILIQKKDDEPSIIVLIAITQLSQLFLFRKQSYPQKSAISSGVRPKSSIVLTLVYYFISSSSPPSLHSAEPRIPPVQFAPEVLRVLFPTLQLLLHLVRHQRLCTPSFVHSKSPL